MRVREFPFLIEGKRMFRSHQLLLAAAFLAAAVVPVRAEDKPAAKKPKVEVVFCLDTTGSMGGLIEGAKQKIWSICNQIANGKPTPDLKVGLVAFRDKGDVYITKVFDLSDDLDAIHGHLKSFKAQGGGDIPESVNQALDDSVNKIKWSTDKETLRIIFLVGDAPPHMDYPDDVKYPVTCKKACEKGIIINTIQCGKDAECTKYWKDICLKAEGSFVQIAQDGGVQVVSTPFDKDLAKINAEMAKSTLVYGSKDRQAEGRAKGDAAAGLSAPAAAERAAYQAKNAQNSAYDLLDDVKKGKVKLEEVKKEDLPEELKKLNLKEQKEYLDNLDKKRAELNKKALELDKQRNEYIAKKQAEEKDKGKESFDNQVLEVLRNQAKKHKIEY
jgi:Mg-chelatase subunit ChlD